MKFDFVAFLGGLTLGAATAAIFTSLKSQPSLGRLSSLAGNGVATMNPRSIGKPTVQWHAGARRRGWL